jgi:hypothetical protein
MYPRMKHGRAFSARYFSGNEDAAEGWRNNNDNPLANSAHFEVYPNSIEQQDKLVSYIEGLDGVRQVNQSEQASTTLVDDEPSHCHDFHHHHPGASRGLGVPDQ